MNKKVHLCFLILVSILLLPVSNAQVKVGFNGGINFSKYSGDKKNSNSSVSFNKLPGFAVGGVLEYGISKTFALRFSPSYLLRGSETKYNMKLSGKIKTIKNKSKTYFIEMPLTAIYKLGKGKVCPYLSGGFNIGFLTKAKSDGEDIKNQFKKVNFSFLFGLGCEFALTKKASVFIDGQYALGLRNLAKNNGKQKTRGIDLKAGVLFAL